MNEAKKKAKELVEKIKVEFIVIDRSQTLHNGNYIQYKPAFKYWIPNSKGLIDLFEVEKNLEKYEVINKDIRNKYLKHKI